MAGYHSVAKKYLVGKAKVGATVSNEHIKFFKTTFVEKHFNTLARSIFAFGVLFFYSFYDATQFGFFT